MDGAMGSELQRAGLREGECAELWNLTRPELVRAIHQRYRDAGARCLLTNTFQANPLALERHGLRHRLQEINQAAVALARSAGDADCFVLGDIGPLGDGGEEKAIGELVTALRDADALLLETCSDLQDLDRMRQAMEQSPASERSPVLFSVTYRRNSGGQIVTNEGLAPEDVARDASLRNIAALGVNCGREIGMNEIVEVIRRYRAVTKIPLFARPNAGTPVRIGSSWHYPRTPQAMASGLPELLEAGVSMVGGCCGATPEHVAAFRQVIEDWNHSAGF
jgi:5-methyltetrahydrofolate--homocysteine methyltransferase